MMTPRSKRRLLPPFVAVALAALLIGTLATGGGAAEAKGRRALVRAKRLFRQATIRFNLGEYAVALELYRKAYTLKPLPGFLFNIGQCHYNLRNYREALSRYQRYLLLEPNAANRADVEAQIRAAKKALEEQEQLENPPATEGTKTQEATSPPETAESPTSAPAATDETPPDDTAETPPPEIAPSTPSARDMPDEPPRPSRRQKILLWSGVGLSAALLIVGGITRGVALSMSSEYSDPSTPVDRQLDLKDSGETLTTFSTLTLALGAAAAVGTGVYYWFGYRVRRAPAPSAAPATSATSKVSTVTTPFDAIPIDGGLQLIWRGTF